MKSKIDTKSIREKILKSAVQLFSEGGIKKLAQPQIAKKAGVPQGHMTYYFPTRADLLMAVAEKSLLLIAKTILNSKNKISPEKMDGVSIVKPLIQDISRTRMMIGLIVEAEENKELKEKLLGQMEFSKKLISLMIRTNETNAEANLVQASIFGLAIQYYLMGQTPASEKNLDESLKILKDKFGVKND